MRRPIIACCAISQSGWNPGLTRAAAKNLKAANFLANNDSTTYFRELGDLVFSGPTQTNVNDFRAILIDP